MTPPPPGRLLSLQAVRAVAASMVVVVHLAGPTAFEAKVFGRSLLQPLWYPAMTGVDLFFVVSGFVMAVTAGGVLTGGARSSLARFAWRRVSRVYPMYWAVSLALLAVVLVAPGLVHGNGEDTSLVASFLLLPQRGEALVMVGWTLVHEMGFYLVFALALLAARHGRWAGRAVLIGWSAFVVVGDLLLPDPASPWLAVATNPLNLEFGLGILAGVLVLRRRGSGGVLVGLGLALLVPAWIDRSVQGPLLEDGLVAALVVGTGCALLVAGLATLERAGRLRVPALLGRLGDSSYSLYLVHVPVVTLAALVADRLLPRLEGGLGVVEQALVVALAFVACQVAGLVAHRLAEQPLLGLTRRLERRVTSARAQGGVVPALPRPAPEGGAVSDGASTLTS